MYVEEELLIVPGEVVSDGWSGEGAVLLQDVDGDALYQNFSRQNSAYIIRSTEVDSGTSDGGTSPSPQSAVTEESIPSDDSASAPTLPTEESSVSPLNTESDASGSDASAPAPAAEPVSTPVEESPTVSLKQAEVFPWAQFDDTVPVDVGAQESVTTDESLVVTPEPEVETTEVIPESVEAPAAAGAESSSEENADGVQATDSIDSSVAEPAPSLQPHELFGIEPCRIESGCVTKTLTFQNFAMPEFTPGTVLDSFQLRLSLAAKARVDSAIQRFVVSYSHDGGVTYLPGTVIDVDGEISNSINGDHFLVSLDLPPFTNDLSLLRVKVAYEGIESELEEAYVDGVWLDVTSGQFYEETDFATTTDSIAYQRDLDTPNFNELMNPDLDVVLGSVPAFTFEYQSQQNFFRRIFNAIFSENTFAVTNVRIEHVTYGAIDVPYTIDYHEDKAWTLRIPNSPQKMHPGKYRAVVSINENEEVYLDSFEFYWGVLAINSTKTRYVPQEEVVFNLAALTDDGDTICDANLALQVISPDNQFYDVPVAQTGACGENNVTDKPDYIATFSETAEIGEYTVVLSHRNQAGEVVHKIEDAFTVADFVAYDIERTAPTRIYPPAPYEVSLKIKANRTFTGDIVERVPRGFVIDNVREDVLIETLPDVTLIKWPQVSLAEGEELVLSYRFDAPDISPYLYLLGPLAMDGYTELRAWQIASDALSGIGWFTGTQTTGGANLNAAPAQLRWSTSSIDTYYYEHSTTTNNERVTMRQAGDYFVAVTLPQQRADGNNRQTRVGVEVRVNGVAVPQGLGRSGFIANANNHSESSSHAHFLLTNISPDDYIEVFAENLITINPADTVNVTGQASLYLEYMSNTETVFAATGTTTVAGVNFNGTASSAIQWTETRQDSGFVHSDTVNPQNITISDPGTYMVHVNVPLSGNAAGLNVRGQVYLNGTIVPGGSFAQGYQQNTTSDTDSSIHWSGIVVATGINQVLTVTTQREGAAGTTTVPTGFVGSVFIQKMPATDVFVARGRDVVSGTDWSPATLTTVRFDTQMATSTTFTHSTVTNNNQITVNQAGDYFLTFNGAFTSTGQRINNRVQVQVGGVGVSGAQVKSNFVRGAGGAAEGSSALTYLLTGLSTSSVITISTVREGNTTAVMNDTTDAVVMLWKKLDFNARPDAPTYFDTPFNNIRFASTTPYFDFASVDSDGTSDLQYEFMIATSSDFASATVRTSGVDAGFSNTASSTDTSPFVENNRIRFQLQSGDALTDLTTYYWRVRARDVSGSGVYGDWSTTQSLTVDLAASSPYWYQTAGGQFESDVLVGAVSNNADAVVVDATDNVEMLVAYGEGTVTTPRYRLWNGTSWGTEQSAVAAGGTINWVETAAAITRDEYAMITLDASNASYAQIYSASTTSWGNRVQVGAGIPGPQYRGVDVVYESVSGDAMVISCGNTADPLYRIWNGSSWSATSTINATSLANCNYVVAAADPSSDEIIVVIRDTGPIYEAHVWDGNAWVENRVLGSSGVLARQGMAVAYEASGDQAVIVTANAANNNFLYTTWNGVEWSTNATQAVGNDFAEARLVADTDSDELLLCYVDIDADTGVLRWDGGVWLGSFQELETTSNGTTARGHDCEYETMAGRTDQKLIAFSDGTNVRYRTATSTSWTTEATVGTIEDSFWVQTERADDGTIITAVLDDTADDIITSYWNGASWSPNDVIETNPSSVIAAPYEPVSLSAKRYQFTQGTVRTQPIRFNLVPSQLTWGDITFSSTEPFGTDVLVRVRYTASTSCDTLVPDAALAGNTAGFDTTELPIDISGVSTTTYSELCLEATITTLGSASASLDDWELSWVRQPKLIQDAYRWYTNGSFLTPTDPWPLGATDLSELMAINSSVPVSDGDVLRLRMSLLGSNVPLATTTKTFKLQYAAAPSCAVATGWSDVGATGSTTALWRGFANSIVGSDWYGGAWTRRIKITVPSSQVTGSDIADFPVYVNLDDLPTQFFDAVQSDGDDIRVTTSDGVTELPHELVSIDTAADTGELHFRATSLSSTTNTAFYIYYGNPSASGYAVTAPYGRNNVWSNNFLAVYHLDQSAAAGAPQFVDSTGNTSGTAQNMEAGDRQTGIVGRFQALDGANEFIDLGATFNRSFLRSTWQIWASSTGNQGALDGLLMTRATGETTGINISSNANRLGYHWRDLAASYNWTGGPTYPTSSAPFLATLTIEPTQAVMWRHAGIGVASGTNAIAHATGTFAAVDIGQDPLGGRLWGGGVDEVSIASVVRSSGWIQTTYNNKSNPTGFYTVSAEEFIGDGRVLTAALLSTTDKTETYEENNPTALNLNGLQVGESAEWDFVLQSNGVAPATQYCFRLVNADGSVLSHYTTYPTLVTNAPPLTANLSAPFDNEQLASTSPWFEFTATDEADDLVSYEIQVDDDYAFASPEINRESNAHFSEFTNLQNPAERSQYTSGQSMRFVPATALTNGVTYYWRVRAKDDLGSTVYSEWSTPESFTVNTGTTITTWFQTTGEQFAINNLEQLVVSTSTDDVRIDTALTAGTTTSAVIDYDDRDTGNAWGSLSFNQNISSGAIRYYVEYRISGETFALVPDTVLPGNSAGFTSSPVALTALDTDIYNEIRLVAAFTGNDSLPRLLDWTVTWGLTIEEPLHVLPFDNAKVPTTTPQLTFFTSDPQGQDLQYEVQLSQSSDFAASSTFVSGVDAGFVNVPNGGDTSPFNSGDTIRYTIQSALTNGTTYWWRVRARDPLGSNAWSAYSEPESFTVDTAVTVSAWYQTTGQQFATNDLTDIETTTGGAQITSVVREVMMAYGEGTGQAPRYRIWDGTAWGAAQTAATIGATPRWLQLRAAPTRSEYALGTIGTDADVNIQIYNGTTEIWGNVFGIENNIANTAKRGFDIAYETTSGDLMAVACSGTEAVYAIWNGTSWSATSSIALTNPNTCNWVQLASDPVSDEIIATFRHINTGTTDFEALVWNGSSWGNSTAFGDMQTDSNEGMAIQYEASGNQAVFVVSNNAATSILWSAWNGSAWSTATATGVGVVGDHIEWASLKRDVGTDALSLCYIDNDGNIGVLPWTGSAWTTTTEIEQLGNSNLGQPVDCEYETLGARDGYLMTPYSDTGAGGVGDGGKYQFYATSSWSGELDLSTIEDSWRVLTTRGADGTIHAVFFDDGNDRWSVTNWNGSTWAPFFNITNPPTTGTPFDGYLTMAPQIYPNFTQGLIRSTPIDFSDGSGPRWERVTFADTTPGASDIRYRIFYQSTSSSFVQVPEVALPGNDVGFTTSPISIAGLDRTIYSVLLLEAELLCVAGNCPSLQEWTLEWSEGINVSGRAYEYDGVSTTTSGTVAVVVNGELQSGKTGTIQPDGTWSIANVSAFEGDSIMVFVNGAADTDEALAYTTYDGVGDVTNMELTKRHFTIGSSDTATTTNLTAVGYDFTDDEDIFLDIAVDGAFNLCVEGCVDTRLKVRSGAMYEPLANVTTHDVVNNGTLRLGTTTLRARGSWNSQGTFVPETSTVIMTATTSSEVLTASGTALSFYNLTLGETTGTASFVPDRTLDINGALTVSWGTLARATTSISVERNLFVGIGGAFSGIGTTTFDGTGNFTWTDQSASTTNVGQVVVDGTAKTVTLGSAVTAQSITIGADDTLNASGSGFNLNVLTHWTNNNLFVPQSGTVTFVGTSTGVIARGTSPFNNLSFTGVGGNWSFSTSTLTINGNFTIATGTVTLPSGTTTIAGSFLNTGGSFAHNNGEVRMTSSVGGRSITTSGSPFLNSFYDLVFTGSGSWSFTDAATTSRDIRITAGSVTYPASTLTVLGDMAVTGSGSFAHNNGEVIFLTVGTDTIATNGSSLNNVRTRSFTGGWYNESWNSRVPITVAASQVAENVTDFPVYVDLATLPSGFFTGVQGSGADIRITTQDGVTEVPYELVRLSTSTSAGELHFKAPSLSSSVNTTFYLYFGNPTASAYSATSTYGRNNVWTNGYLAVYHLDESPTAAAPQYIGSTGTTTGTSNNMEAGDQGVAQVGRGQTVDGTNEFIQTTFAASVATSTWSAWIRTNGAQGAYDGLVFSRGSVTSGLNVSGNGTTLGYHWNDAAATWGWTGGPTYPQNQWFYTALVINSNNATIYRYATSGSASSTNTTTHTASTINDLKFAQDDSGGRFFNGSLDEVRLSNVSRTPGWLTTEYNNQISAGTFYSVGSIDARFSRIFSDTNATILGNYIAERGGDARFPSGVLSVGGSFNNDALFDANNGTVRFNSVAGSETVAAGSSTFATLEFSSQTGDFTVTEHATATVAVNLLSASQFTLSSGISLTSAGTFTNNATGTNTTWTGSILRFTGSDFAMNSKTHAGDSYDTIEVQNDADVSMWNSSATTYTTANTASLYSQDHAGVDGDLSIFGNYVRSSGTEYWSFNRDFDGVVLGSGRQVDVRIATGSSIGFVNASLDMVGSSSASTSVAAISGAYALNATNTTITAEYFTVTQTDVNGFGLYASTTLATFTNGAFDVVPGRTGIRIDGTTVDTNPAKQLTRINFATSSAGTASNVTFTGTSTSFVWFKEGSGNLYGEAFDAGDLNPGSVRFDDSSYLITVSGRVLTNNGAGVQGAPVCDGTTQNVRLVVNSGSYTAVTSCNGTTGQYTFNNVAFVGDPKITVYLNTNGGIPGAVITKTPTTNITNLDLYTYQVMVRHEGVSPMTIADLTLFDTASDTDMRLSASTSPSTTLTVLAGSGLYVASSSTFAPGGPVTLAGNASSSAFEGTLTLATSSTFVATGNDTHSLAGRLVVGQNASITAASSTFVFTATTTGKSITSSSTLNLHNISFTGTGGAWHIGAPISLTGNMSVAAGTVTGTSDITLTSGQLTGNGTLSLGAGTTTIALTNTLGGTTPWTFANLRLGTGSMTGTTTPAASATTTVSGRLTIATAHTFDVGAMPLDLTGSGTVFVVDGTFRSGTGLVRYSGTNATVLGTTYYDLSVGALVGSSTFTTSGVGLLVNRNAVIGNGTASSTLTLTVDDPAFTVLGDTSVAAASTLSLSDTATTTLAGSYDNNGQVLSNGGLVRFTGSGVHTIAAGASALARVLIDGAGTFTVTESATTSASLILRNHALFTVATGTTLAVAQQFSNELAGASTNFAGNLYFFGGTGMTINTKSTSDTYGAVVTAADTRVRMWNSTASSYGGAGGVYSQDHGGTDGLLHIYGAFNENSATDYWSYATDFDGASLSGVERPVTVAFAAGASARFTGGALYVQGTTAASTTIENQGVGTYSLTIGGTATTSWNSVVVRDIDSAGIVFTGSPTVLDFSRTDHFVQANSGTAMTVGGSVLNANEARNFTFNSFVHDTGVTGATNVTATGTAVSSWRFTNHVGNIAGEGFDVDPAGDPGYLVWDDSAALITVSGNVYSDEGTTVSTVCDGVTNNVVLRVAGLTTYSTSCNATTGAYTITNVAYNALDSLVLFIDGETQKAAHVTRSPISSISNFHLYENRVIVRHENTDPLTIANMAVWDSSDDADIPFTAVDAGTDILTIPSNYKLIVWTGKTFAPGGNVTVTGNGSGSALDGTLEVFANGRFRAVGTEQHTIGGSMIFASGAVFEAGQSTTTFSSTAAGRTIDINEGAFYNVVFTGSGSWTIADTQFTTTRSFAQSAGTVTFGAGTTTIGASFNATGGAFTMSGSALVFTSTTTGNTVRFDDSAVPSMSFAGTGGAWSMLDTNATTTGSVLITAAGTVTLPSGALAVGGSFINASGTVTHNTNDLRFTGSGSNTLYARGSDLFAVRHVGAGTLTILDGSITLRDDLEIALGSVVMATNTTAIAGSLAVTGGTFNHASGTVLFNATAIGKTINASTSQFYNVQFGSASGGWTWNGNATTSNNLTLSTANSLVKEAGTTLAVGGVFTNLVGGAPTTWTNTTLSLYGTAGYTINTKTAGGDVYGALQITNADIRAWDSSAATTTMIGTASLYSQDHGAVTGALTIYGDFSIATTTEYWSYATDFDGTVLTGGARRAAAVRIAAGATTTLTSGALQINGALGATTTIAAEGVGTYALLATGGTFSMTYASVTNMWSAGLSLSGAVTVSDFEHNLLTLSVNTGSLLSVTSAVLDANASAIYDANGFESGSVSGYSVELIGTTSNAWRFTNAYGDLGTEDFDIDGIDACGSIRFDDSACLLTTQSDVRWRNDDGGEGVPNTEWFDGNWAYRQQVRFLNDTGTSYATTALKVVLPYDSSMQSNFADIRFTADDGVTPVSYWIERYTASTEAVAWVKVSSMPANTYTTVFAYFGNGTATTTSDAGTTFSFVDTFEDNNITEYTGNTGLFQTDTTPVYGGTYALEAANKSGRTTDGIYQTGSQTAQGQTIRWMQYIDTTAGSGDEACTLFGVQNANQNYALCLEQFGTDRIAISKDVDDNDVSGTVLASSTITYATGWYEVEVDWGTDNRITAYVYNTAGSLVASTTAVDSSYTSGGMGFTFWFQNGAWDSYTVRPLAVRRPTTYIGAKQADGGASWVAAQNASGAGIPGEVRRLRVGIENSGLDITGQQFRLEYAPKGVAPSCEAVSGGSYAAVPNQASCGSSPICMQTSTFVADGEVTTDLLRNMSGRFTSGSMVESPSFTATTMDVDQDFYTELEYVITPTLTASDNYCFRVSNAGTPLDYYETVAELSLQFDPSFGTVALNNGLPISLMPNATTTVYATGTVTDFNGYADIVAGTSTIYRSGAGAGCAADNNNCYISSTGNGCTFTNCSGNTCTLECRADIYFHADPTDAATYEGEEWLAYLEVSDASSGYDFASALGVELLTMRALSVDTGINYGALAPLDNTGTYNPTTTITNTGNVPFDIEVEGTDLSDGSSSVIPANQQKFATSTFSYSACVTCSLLSSSTPVELAVNLAKPTNPAPAVTTQIYWGIAVPYGVNSAPHSGINVFTPVNP